MLVLSRYVGESVVIPSLGVRIEVLRLGGGQVKLGIAAPKEVAVHREEVRADIAAGKSQGTSADRGTAP